MSLSCDAITKFASELGHKLEAYVARFDDAVAADICRKLDLLADRDIRDPTKAIQLLSDNHSPEEWSGARILVEVGGTQSLASGVRSALVEARNPELRFTCVGLLGLLRGNEAADALIDVLRNDADADLRFHAAHYLALFRHDGRVARALVDCLESEREGGELVRAESARSLGFVGGADAQGPLLRALEDSSAVVRYWAADALGSVGDERAIEPLLAMAERDALTVTGEDSLRESALSGISNILARRAEEKRRASG